MIETEELHWIEPYEYNSVKEYKADNTSPKFWLVLIVPISFFILFTSTYIITFIAEGAQLFYGVTGIVLSSVMFYVTMHILENEYDYVNDIIEEYRIRKALRKRKGHMPIKSDALKMLNGVVKMYDGKMYRAYQFINAEKSNKRHIAMQYPEYSIIINNDDTCMFSKLNEKEIMAIVDTILNYHQDKAMQEEIERKERNFKKQSDINRTITQEDINNLPLHKSLESISDEIDDDFKRYSDKLQHYNDELKSKIH